jgi:hypothetical protein
MTYKFPWYRWHIARWLSSRSRLTMTPLERSVYRDLLDHLYMDGSIPNDPTELAIMAAVTEQDFAAAWPVVSKRFVPHPTIAGHLSNTNAADEMTFRENGSWDAPGPGRKKSPGRCPCGQMTADRANKRGHKCQETNSVNSVKRSFACQKTELEPELRTENLETEQTRTPEDGVRSFDSLENEKTSTQEDEFLAAYPNSGTGRAATLRAYRAVITTPGLHAELMDGLRRWLDSDRWTRSLKEDGGTYIPQASRFIRDGMFREHPPKSPLDLLFERYPLIK